MFTKLLVWYVFLDSTECFRFAEHVEPNLEELEFESSKDEGQHAVLFRGEGLPRTVIQFGTPRTATTLEFQTLCAVMSVLHASEPNPVLCTYEYKLTYVENPEQFRVLKTHQNVWDWPANMVDDATWVFATLGGTDGEVQLGVLKEKFDIEPKYVQIMQDVKDVGTKLAYDYQSVFNLSDQQIHDVYDYVSLWSVLRQCCGCQMSKHWRDVLLQKTNADNTTTGKMCASKDLDDVESRLMRTTVHGLLGSTDKLSIVDLAFNGKYCSWFNKQVACKKLQFNEMPQEPYC
uniref:Uncharacterized protein n=1 Tax=Noctiluca scintillans TaxID=2966 RepID=A0A7S1AFH5_NOCSC|mmetsp:Transcript_44069/g.116548  ORF Transcript_44069/g.116548 Transcript_44069/m.116548 type:complete len:289 (+) Transcript_44069:43-909(+)